ncbi:hypothetical protein C8F01DRAFT_1143348 [Mycena amicta]|nr:hypothetical protein C8F01DRAFT_1143348 [Mycena amicta]
MKDHLTGMGPLLWGLGRWCTLHCTTTCTSFARAAQESRQMHGARRLLAPACSLNTTTLSAITTFSRNGSNLNLLQRKLRSYLLLDVVILGSFRAMPQPVTMFWCCASRFGAQCTLGTQM